MWHSNTDQSSIPEWLSPSITLVQTFPIVCTIQLIAFRYIAKGVGKHRKSVENLMRGEYEPQRRSYGASPNFTLNWSHGLN